MKIFYRLIIAVWISFCLLLATGCGFHLRGASNLPPQLQTLYLGVQKPDAPFNQELRNLLLSLNIKLTDTAAQAPFVLNVGYDFSHSTPQVTTSNQTVTYTYTLRVVTSINASNGRIVVPKHVIMLQHDLMMNTDEIYTPNTSALVKEQMQRDAVNMIYFWLINKNTHKALAKAKSVIALPRSSAGNSVIAQ